MMEMRDVLIYGLIIPSVLWRQKRKNLKNWENYDPEDIHWPMTFQAEHLGRMQCFSM